jgi:hypothetical protein
MKGRPSPKPCLRSTNDLGRTQFRAVFESLAELLGTHRAASLTKTRDVRGVVETHSMASFSGTDEFGGTNCFQF